MTTTLTKYTPKEELWNCIIHGTGIGLSITGLVLLAVFSAIYGDAWVIVSAVIFGVSMTVLYTASTLYHAFRDERIKRALKKFDHISIYFLIAGTYEERAGMVLRIPRRHLAGIRGRNYISRHLHRTGGEEWQNRMVSH